MYWFLRWILNALCLFLISEVVPGIQFSSTWSLAFAVIIFGLINALIRPVILLLTLPVNILTLGFFTLIINALMLWLTSSIVKGFEISNFASAFWGAIVYWLLTILINYFDKKSSPTT